MANAYFFVIELRYILSASRVVLLCKLLFCGREDDVIPEIWMFYKFLWFYHVIQTSTRAASEQCSHSMASLLDHPPRNQ